MQLLDQSRILSLELSWEGKKIRRQKIYSRTNNFRCPDKQLLKYRFNWIILGIFTSSISLKRTDQNVFVNLTPAEASLCRRGGRGEGKRKCSADDGKGKDMKRLSSRFFPVPIVPRALANFWFNITDFYSWNTQREPLRRREIQTQSEELNLRKKSNLS